MPLEFTVKCYGYEVTTRTDGSYFTVYRGTQIMGTIARPQLYDRKWSAWTVEGRFLGNTIGPRTALGLFMRNQRNQPMPEDHSGFIDGKGIIE